MMKRTFGTWGIVASAIALGAVLSTVTGLAQGRQGGAAPAPAAAAGASNVDNIQINALHVQGNVWMLTGGGFNSAVSIGDDGILVVDTMIAPLGEKLLAKIKEIGGNKPIRMIINTHAHADHVGGNPVINAAGDSIVAGNFAGQANDRKAQIFAHENTQDRMLQLMPPLPATSLPTDTFFGDEKTIYFNGEAIVMRHQPAAHTDGDITVFFRKSDVIAAGDVYVNTTFPIFMPAQGGSFQGIINALNDIIDTAVPKEKEEGGTYIIPGHGRLVDEWDVVDARDMDTIIRDRFQDAIKKGQTLEQVKAANLVMDYEGRWGAKDGFWTTNSFIEAVYNSLKTPPPASTSR
jgi:glyoxylase-like metal-dependent hydrolase (beta-lactamase superfamily II)